MSTISNQYSCTHIYAAADISLAREQGPTATRKVPFPLGDWCKGKVEPPQLELSEGLYLSAAVTPSGTPHLLLTSVSLEQDKWAAGFYLEVSGPEEEG